uniref:t-SNARE coiled-coil homology domain-containing protein n=1 Tax=Elaeophora elaphi TaxID=1147741 RepID=A0A0R3RW15_9BILA
MSASSLGTAGEGISKILYDHSKDELINYKRRIDANTEQQREHADIVATLQRKVKLFVFYLVIITIRSIRLGS